MIVSTDLVGASDAFLRHTLIGLGEHNAIWFAGPGRALPPFPQWKLRYRPDPIAPTINLYDAAALYRDEVGSCGSIAAAFYGWLRSTGDRATFLVKRNAQSAWHGLVRTEAGLIWDPTREVPHAA